MRIYITFHTILNRNFLIAAGLIFVGTAIKRATFNASNRQKRSMRSKNTWHTIRAIRGFNNVSFIQMKTGYNITRVCYAREFGTLEYIFPT